MEVVIAGPSIGDSCRAVVVVGANYRDSLVGSISGAETHASVRMTTSHNKALIHTSSAKPSFMARASKPREAGSFHSPSDARHT